MLQLRVEAMEQAIENQSLSLRAVGLLWKVIPYAFHDGLPTNEAQLARLAGITSQVLRRVWPEIERFFERRGDRWFPVGVDWVRSFGVGGIERQSLLHLRDQLIAFWGRRCAYCGATGQKLQIEHIIPVVRGGSDSLSNLTLACQPCNLQKNTQTAAEFGHPHSHDLAARIQ